MAGPQPGERQKRAQSLVEFALLLPLLLILIFAIIDFGYYLFIEVTVNHATRAGLRRAVMNTYTRSQIVSHIQDQAVGVAIPDPSSTIRITTRANDATFPPFTPVAACPPSCVITLSFEHPLFLPGFWGGYQKVRVYSTFKGIVTTYEGKTTVTF